MIPDLRLLVRVDALPFMPGGAREVHCCPKCSSLETCPWLPDDYETNDYATPLGTFCSDCRHRAASFDFLDLSEPEKICRFDVRLDVLPWVLRVLDLRAEKVIRRNGEWWLCDAKSEPIPGCFIQGDREILTGFHTSPELDLTDLTFEEQIRAVVADVLNYRKAS